MKKIINKIYTLFAASLLLANAAMGQLPLQQGDAVVTHSPNNSIGGAHIVVRTIRTSNTTTALMNGTPWLTPAKPVNYNHPFWIADTLGSVFGITLDDRPSPDIYVSNTQIYGGVSNKSKIWRLSGTTGIHSLVFDFHNVARSLGNLKYLRVGGNENIYVSNWDDGAIHRLTGNSAATTLWNDNTVFNPKFGLANDDPKYLPYGIAVRNIGGNYRLYYSRISTVSPVSANEVWSVDLDAAGDFLPLTETKEITPAISTVQPIADIAFTADGKRMLLGQQTWYGFAGLSAHGSSVAEFAFTAGHNWGSSFNNYPSGTYSSHTNAVGGVSYSNNILQADGTKLGCDSTVWFTSDAATLGSVVTSQVVYGIEGMKIRNNGFNDAVFADEDDYTATCCDKTYLGDVEVFKIPLDCNPCSCGHWATNPTLNGGAIPGVPLIHTADLAQGKQIRPASAGAGPIGPIVIPQNYPIQFVQGNVSGLINATYLCNGDCGATYTWEIKNDATGAMLANGTALPVDLAVYNNQLKCGKYTLVIKAKCGASNCESLVIPITIICEPVNCCKAQIDISLEDHAIYAATNIPNPNAYSTANFNFMLNYSLPMSEVRVSVEEFQLKANSPNCLNCNNRPVTWGNILSATLNGTAMPLSGTVAPPTGSLPADYREAVYNVGTPLAPSSAGLSLQLSLPAVTELSCCEVKAYVCLKFTFKDTQCRECVQMVCGEVKLIPKNNPHVDNPKDKIEIKKFNVNH